jgi:hypothetical protein
MNRAIVIAMLVVGLLGASWAAYRVAVPPQAEPELSRLVPSGALLYLQAKDFSSLLSGWNQSREKGDWLASKNYEVFSRSRLFLRLKDAGGEFSAAARLPATSDLLRQVAGRQSALAIYDIGKLQFVYITRLPSTDFAGSTLWQTRSSFESRTAGSIRYFYRKDPDSGRETTFAVHGDYLFLATREDLMARSLELLGGAKNPSLAEEPWMSRSVVAAGAPGDLRMVLNLDKIIPSPYFRSYWLPQNITGTSHFSAAISDLTREASEYREERTLLKKDSTQTGQAKGAVAVADLLRLVPAKATWYEAKADPEPKDSLELLTADILSPHRSPFRTEKVAPDVQLGNGETGSSADLETRIDQPPTQNVAPGDSHAALQDVLAKSHILAELQIKCTDRDPSSVFVHIHSAVAFLGERDWDQRAVQAALVGFVQPEFTTNQMGMGWKDSSGFRVLDGLWPLSIAVRGKYLIVSSDPSLMEDTLGGMKKKTATSAAEFAAGFDFDREVDNFASLTRLLDRQSPSVANDTTPQFFSENVGSLGSTLRNVSSEKIVIHDNGDRQTQTVVYRWIH